MDIDLDMVTVQDCIDLFEKKNMETILNDGHIVDFTYFEDRFDE
jgi:hypothetical protein